MRKFLGMSLGLALSVVMSAGAYAQKNPRGLTKVTLNGKTISIEYGRPGLHGKTIGQELARLPVGQYWRLGADKSTTFTTAADLRFGNVTVPKGIYSLFARKEAGNKWSLAFNKQHGQWGIKPNAMANLNPKLNIASVPLGERTIATSAQLVTITLANAGGNEGKLTVHWGDMELTTRFTAE